MRPVGYILSSIAIIISIVWFYFEPGFEPLVTSVAGLGGLVFTIRLKRPSPGNVEDATEPLDLGEDKDGHGQPTGKDLPDSELPTVSIKILKSLSELRDMETVSTSQIAERFQLQHQVAKFYLDILQRRGLTDGPYLLDEGQQYCLSEEGRRLLFQTSQGATKTNRVIDNEFEKGILAAIGIEKNNTHTSYSLTSKFDIPLIKIEYYLDKLTSEGFIEIYAKQAIVLRSGEVLAKCYRITEKGRAFLVENNII